jgi:hypothetical protein
LGCHLNSDRFIERPAILDGPRQINRDDDIGPVLGKAFECRERHGRLPGTALVSKHDVIAMHQRCGQPRDIAFTPDLPLRRDRRSDGKNLCA